MEELEALVFFRTPSSTGWSGIERRPVGPIQRPIPCDVGLLFDRPSTCDALKSRLWDVTAGELHVGSKLACFFFFLERLPSHVVPRGTIQTSRDVKLSGRDSGIPTAAGVILGMRDAVRSTTLSDTSGCFELPGRGSGARTASVAILGMRDGARRTTHATPRAQSPELRTTRTGT